MLMLLKSAYLIENVVHAKEFIMLYFHTCAQTSRLNRKAACVSVTMVTPMEEFDLMLQFWLITPTSDASSVPMPQQDRLN